MSNCRPLLLVPNFKLSNSHFPPSSTTKCATMGDARAIYAQFASTPLKIRAARSASSDAEASDGVTPAAAAAVSVVDSAVDETGARACSPPATAALVSPSGPSPPSQASASSEVVKKQQATTTALTRKRKRSSAAATTGGDTQPLAVPSGATKRRSRRVASPANALKEGAKRSGEQLQTPPEDSRPTKRIRKTAAKSPSEVKQQVNSSTGGRGGRAVKETEEESESRSLLSAFALCDGNDDTEVEKTDELTTPPKLALPMKKRRSQQLQQAMQPVVSAASRSVRERETAEPPEKTEISPDFVTDACDALLQTETISGALFAVALNSLRSLQDEITQVRLRGTMQLQCCSE